MEFGLHPLRSWAYKPNKPQLSAGIAWKPSSLSVDRSIESVLAYGNGRSYGDSCLNSAGAVFDARHMNRILDFDTSSGVITGEAGLLLTDILNIVVPKGWFFPVCPGTSQITLAGAVANDVHGKNHHKDGTLGLHVKRFGLLRSNGTLYECSRDQNADLFSATIGGLGLTGFISDVSIQLFPIRSSLMEIRYDTFKGLDAFASLSNRRKHHYQYTVAWIDCANSGDNFARGVFMSANHLASTEPLDTKNGRKNSFTIPFNFPSKCLNKYSIRALNSLYFRHYKMLDQKTVRQDYRQFFFPLDTINNWNRIYGSKGFHQYQFVIPLNRMDVMEKVFSIIVDAGMGSFLAVLKEFGSISSPGLISFPREGWCLALDFAERGAKTIELINKINVHVMNANGAVYPAKDRLMTPQTFFTSFPELSRYLPFKDAAFSSDFWKRVHG